MSMRPIDLQSAISATKEVEKIQQHAAARQQQHAAAIADTLEVSRQREATQVHETTRTQTDTIKERERRRERKKRKKKGRAGDADPDERVPGAIYNPHAELEDLARGPHRDLTI